MDLSLILLAGIFLIPLLVSLFLFSLRKKLSDTTIAALGVGASLITFILSLIVFIKHFNHSPLEYSYQWITLPGVSDISTGIFLTNISLIMLLLVSGISLLVQVFSIEYMKGDTGYGRYFAYLSFFTFSMLGIISTNNLLIIFVFWELVGFASYLLIGFWFSKHSAAQASKKAFIVNRIGDIGFLLGILIIWSVFKTLDIKELSVLINVSSGTVHSSLIFFAGLGLFAGCMGKSAQFPLLVWLPDAMEGPTPVSALIHAATMVAAGVFLLARIFFILDLDVLTVIAFVGAITAFMGGVAALKQYDIKKVLAYSTISQLGYMVMAMGVGAYQASFFHLITHAFFKAGLFLCAGAIIHALHKSSHHIKGLHFDAQDMRLMGGLRKDLPFTFIIYCITAAALVGIPFTSGFLSKDAIIANAITWSNVMSDRIGFISYLVPLLALITIFLTAFYMGRQIILVFFGESRSKEHLPKDEVLKIKENPWPINLPLIVLGVFSFFFIFSLNPFNPEHSFLFKSLGKELSLSSPLFENRDIIITEINHRLPDFHLMTLTLSLILIATGLGLAIKKYYKKEIIKEQKDIFLSKLSFNNWYLDVIYQKTVLKFVDHSAEFVNKIDRKIIDSVVHFVGYFTVIFSLVTHFIDKVLVDGLINFSVIITGRVGVLARSFQGGKVQYLFVVAVLSLILMIFLIAF
ncbi:MAG TPA: NADH-quinone oxidoreductase subunit L [Cytophagales bacterium]|nr:NADH-quinone oxidoreductase subunit L [Cytophagales bacterium]